MSSSGEKIIFDTRKYIGRNDIKRGFRWPPHLSFEYKLIFNFWFLWLFFSLNEDYILGNIHKILVYSFIILLMKISILQTLMVTHTEINIDCDSRPNTDYFDFFLLLLLLIFLFYFILFSLYIWFNHEERNVTFSSNTSIWTDTELIL